MRRNGSLVGLVTIRGSDANLFGAALEIVDYDSDGGADLLVGEPGGVASTGGRGGVVSGYLGPFSRFADPEEFVRWESGDEDDDLSQDGALATGDVDGDGQPDVAIGTRYTTTGDDARGRVYLQGGAASGVVDVTSLLTIAAADSTWWFGDSVAFVPDWDGDGGDELAIGAPATSSSPERASAGAVYVFSSDQLE